jgi:ubiquinone/menaquinone biosynthesis C-methylase UbiE
VDPSLCSRTRDAQRKIARAIPPDATFDGAYLVTVLGEIPSPTAALRELRRVVSATGLTWKSQKGSRFSYFARLEVT